MYLLVAGYRYKNAPLAVREQFSFKKEELPAALKRLINYPAIKEGVILSTCNRTEIYCYVEDVEVASGSIVRFLADYHNLELPEIRKYMFTLIHDDTAKQIFRVTSGLDSLVLGENQITCQVKQSLEIAQQAGTAGSVLDKLFKSALTTSKRVRTSVPLGSSITSISSAAVEMAVRQVDDFSNSKVTVLGAGQMATLAIKYLIAKYDHQDITIVNRSAATIELPCQDNPVNTVEFCKLQEVLKTTDILFVCTSAPHNLVSAKDLPGDKPLVIIDISVPRNVNEDVTGFTGVKLFNTDDLKTLIDTDTEKRDKLINSGEKIVKDEVERFYSWFNALEIVPTLTKVRDRIEEIRKTKLETMRSRNCPYSQERCQVIEDLSRQIVRTILHDPTVRIKATKDHEDLFQAAKLLSELFNLDN